MEKWNRKYHGVGLAFEDKVVRIKNDALLEIFLRESIDRSYRLAAFCKKAYRKKFKKDLLITTDSLAIEIFAHYRLQKTSFKVEDLVGENKGTDWMLLHMSVIDCGERDIDNNRFLWDWMSQLHEKK